MTDQKKEETGDASKSRPTGGLIFKLSRVMASIDRVAKRGRNDVHKYDYATEADIADNVRSAMAEQGVMLIPDVISTEWRIVEGRNGQIPMCILQVEFTVTDGTEERKFKVIGSGMDFGDKGPYKALTGAEKYALLKLFLIPTGDDPEREDAIQQAKAPAVETVSPKQVDEFWKVARANIAKDALEGRVRSILAKFKVEHTKDLPADKYEAAMVLLTEKE